MAVTFSLRPNEALRIDGTLPPPVTIALPFVRIGRADDCDFCVQHPSVAPHHATLEQRGGLFLLKDEGSDGGTFLEGIGRLPPRVEHVVRNGSVVRLGAVTLALRFEATAGASSSRGTMKLASRLVDEALARHDGQGVILSVREGPGRHKELRLRDGGSYIVGRGRDVDLQLEDLDVSRHHTRVFVRDGKVLVRDLGSSNGTYLGSARLEQDSEVLWPHDSLLRLGGTSLGHESALEAALRELAGTSALVQDTAQEPESGLRDTKEGKAPEESMPQSAATAAVPMVSEAGAPIVELPLASGSPQPIAASSKDSFEKWMRLVVFPLAFVVIVASLIGLCWIALS